MKRIHIIIIVCVLILLLIVGGIFYLRYFGKKTSIQDKIKNEQTEKISHGSCLQENEYADYSIDERYAKEIKMPTVPVVVSIKNSISDEIRYSFTINNFVQSSLAVHKCGIYVLRDFDRESPNYREELWKYDYNGKGNNLFLLFAFLNNQPQGILYNGFIISLDEKYLVLEKSYLGKDDYALVIKDLETNEDLFVFKLKDILAQNKEILPGSISLGGWTKDGKYLRGDIFDGALDTAYYQIEAGIWKAEIYPTPPDMLAGVERAMNYSNWNLAYVDIPTFTGVQGVYEQIIEKAKKEGKQKNLYLYNLKTKEKIKIISTDLEKRFNLKWFSDTELQYELPNGEKKIYIVK